VNGINSLAEESDLKPRGEMVKEPSRLKVENKWLADDLGLKNLNGSRRKKDPRLETCPKKQRSDW
jgi:regulator of replication initiation timing